MDAVRDKVFDIIRTYRIARGEILPERVLLTQSVRWSPPESRALNETLQTMVKDGLLDFRDGKLFLTDAGESIAYGE